MSDFYSSHCENSREKDNNSFELISNVIQYEVCYNKFTFNTFTVRQKPQTSFTAQYSQGDGTTWEIHLGTRLRVKVVLH